MINIQEMIKSMGIDGGIQRLAEVMGVSRSTVYNWVRANNYPMVCASLDYALKLQREEYAEEVGRILNDVAGPGVDITATLMGPMLVVCARSKHGQYSKGLDADYIPPRKAASIFWLQAKGIVTCDSKPLISD